MNNKLHYIQDKKINSSQVNVTFSDGKFKVVLSKNDWIKVTDGFWECSTCTFRKQKQEIFVQYKQQPPCPHDGTTLKWDLQKQWGKQSSLQFLVDLLTDFIDDNALLKHNYEHHHVGEALSLLSESQQQRLLPIFVNSLFKLKIQYIKDFSSVKKQVNEIVETKKQILTAFETESKKVEDRSKNIVNELHTKIYSEIESIVKGELERIVKQQLTHLPILNEQEDFEEVKEREKIKRTLNIMMELWEKGTDFKSVLAKAAMDIENNSYQSTFTLNNWNLDNNNENGYLGLNLIDKTTIFKRFLDV